ncbi:MAG: addiction module antidote protein, HigA family [Verrucomicrobia bacterium]|nr:MAG: addiction module antidote protein, HigA family [Verrucomicrobiota bacterium]
MTTETPIISNLPVPPGEYLEEVLEELGMSKSELATRMGRPLSKLSAIFKGAKAITPDTAIQLERVTGVAAHIWTGLETEYRLAQARQREEAREEQCKEEISLVTVFCYNELKKLNCVPAYTRAVDKVKALQDFFGVMSLTSVLEMPRYKVAFRHGARTESERSSEAVAAWLRVGETVAHKAECAPFDYDRLAGSLDVLRAMTCMEPEEFSGPLRETLAQAGVALIPCPHFPKTKAHGATFFLNPDKAVLMITLRYKWADIFWFSLFHEIGHILLHGKKAVILEDSESNSREVEADTFARDQLITPQKWKSFVGGKTGNGITEFSEAVGVAPGIVVGRLHHEGLLDRAQGNDLRRQYQFSVNAS